MFSILRNHSRRPLALSAIVIVAFIAVSPLFDRINGQAFDLLSTTMAKKPDRPGALIVAIDEPSFSAIGRQWPWSRDLHARLLTSLRKAGAKAVAFDIVFAEPSDPAADASLAMTAGPDTLFAADETQIETLQGSTLTRTEPLPEMLARGAKAGVASLSMDGDGVLRRMPRYPDGFAARLAGVKPPDGDRMIQYFGPPNSYPRISYYQALDPARYLPRDLIKGRTVIVGYALQTAPVVTDQGADSYETPWSAATGMRTYGVEIQATIFDNLVHGLSITPAGFGPTLALALFAGLIGWAATAARLPAIQALLVLVALGASIVLCWLLLAEGRVFLSPAPAAATLLGTALILGGFDFAVEQRRRREIIGAFGHYLSPAMVDRLVADPTVLNLGGESRDMTILFADIRGFSKIAEEMGDNPQRLVEMINAILTPLSDVVLRHGGTIDKFMGDCIMAFWNAPLNEPRHALRGYECALDIAAIIPVIDADLHRQDPSLPRIRIGVGLNSGSCVVGNIGSTYRFDYSVLGDAVNIASRLEGLCGHYDVPVILGEQTAARLPPGTRLREIDRIAVRGRDAKLSIYAPG